MLIIDISNFTAEERAAAEDLRAEANAARAAARERSPEEAASEDNRELTLEEFVQVNAQAIVDAWVARYRQKSLEALRGLGEKYLVADEETRRRIGEMLEG